MKWVYFEFMRENVPDILFWFNFALISIHYINFSLHFGGHSFHLSILKIKKYEIMLEVNFIVRGLWHNQLPLLPFKTDKGHDPQILLMWWAVNNKKALIPHPHLTTNRDNAHELTHNNVITEFQDQTTVTNLTFKRIFDHEHLDMSGNIFGWGKTII